MGLFGNLFKKKKRISVIGLDGVPHSFLLKRMKDGTMPFLKKLVDSGGHFQRMNSVIPTISSVAWSTFMTGKDCSGHGIFGFIDRHEDPFKMYIPLAKNMRSETLWEYLSKKDKRVFVMNVPVTYPPKKVNGTLISGFLCTDISKSSYPAEVAEELKSMDYVIDADAWLARESKDKFMDQLFKVLKKRFEVMTHFYKKEKWDFFQCHIMDTDRLSHFFWKEYESGSGKFHDGFIRFFNVIDTELEKFSKLMGQDDTLMILSDHGFCLAEKEFYINKWLRDEGYLKFDNPDPKNIEGMNPDSKAYSLIPGRVFINLKGREEKGSVAPSEYDKLRDELIRKIKKIKDPETGEEFIKDVFKREDIYDGEFIDDVADLIVIPRDGIDVKGNVNKSKLLEEGFISGMHTYHDAFLYLNKELGDFKVDSIRDCFDLIINLLEVNEK